MVQFRHQIVEIDVFLSLKNNAGWTDEQPDGRTGTTSHRDVKSHLQRDAEIDIQKITSTVGGTSDKTTLSIVYNVIDNFFTLKNGAFRRLKIMQHGRTDGRT